MNIHHIKPIPALTLLLGCLLVTGSVYAQKVQVNSADPSEGEQLTTLEVTIKGNGFGDSAAVNFFLTGTENLGDVIVEDVEVLSSKKLVAKIIIDDSFDPQDYDIEVKNLSTGRRGKGHTLFKVLKKGGGKEYPQYDVYSISGDLGVYGTDWEGRDRGEIEWGRFWDSGTGTLDLGYFLTGTQGANCFGTNGGFVSMVTGGFSQEKSGSAFGALWFDAYADDGTTPVRYWLEVGGGFMDPTDWYPLEANTIILTTWIMHAEARGKRTRNITCVGEGVFDHPVLINLVKSN